MNEERVPVRRCTDDAACPDQPTAAADVLDNDALSERCRHRVCDRPCRCISCATRDEGYDNRDGAVRKALARGWQAAQRKEQDAGTKTFLQFAQISHVRPSCNVYVAPTQPRRIEPQY